MKNTFDLANTPLTPGVTLIEASAGTGKTSSLTGLILRLVVEEHIAINKILAVTYTIAATAELKERVRRRLYEAIDELRRGHTEDAILKRVLKAGDATRGVHELDLALQSFDEAQVFTIHSFCQHVLQDHAFESGISFDTELVTDPTPLFEQVARDFWRSKFHGAPPLISALMLAWEKSPNEWAELLDRKRSHPEVVFIPPATGKLFNQLAAEIEESIHAIRREWKSSASTIERILREDENLARNQNAFRLDRVEELLSQIDQACGDFKSADPMCIRALAEVTAEKIKTGTKPSRPAPTHRFFDLCTGFVDAVAEVFLRSTYDFLQYADQEIPKRKARTNTVTFDDLILRLRDALKSPAGERLAAAVSAKYRAALIDEFQDTDPAQYEIFRRLFAVGKHHLYYIGDPKQAVYGFRGADVFTYIAAAADANRTFTLGTNWRSEKQLVGAVNDLFQQADDPFVLPGIKYHDIRPADKTEFPLLANIPKTSAARLAFRMVASTRENGEPMNQTEATAAICQAVAGDMTRLQASGATLGDRPVGFADMAVLVRKHRQAEQMQEVLREHGIRSIVQTDRSVFETNEAEELQRLLQGIIEPARDRLFKAALITSLIGLNGDALVELETDEAARQQWLDKFAGWRARWTSECFIAAFRQIMVEQNARARLMQLPGGERRLTNFLHLAELLHAAETAQRLVPDGLAAWLRRQRNIHHVAQDDFQLRLESDSNAVQILTIHKCKGLEYPIVFCPFLWTPAESSQRKELLFHDRNYDNRLTLSLRGTIDATDEQKRWQSEEITSEEVRMLYVAVTRAKNRCTVHVPDYKEIEQSPLARLFSKDKRADLANALRELATQRPECISVSPVPADSVPIVAPRTHTLTFAARPFNGTIDRTAMVASFSGLNTGRIELEEREPEISDQPEIALEERVTSGDTIFDFERGARAGDFFHAVLERINFTAPELDSLVDEQLGWHGFGKSKCRDSIISTLHALLEIQLEPGLSLKKVDRSARISELEFTYRLNRLDPNRLRAIFTRCNRLPAEFSGNLGRLRFDPVEGYLRGFIDLFFQFDDRYYIIDWKSNWLGNYPADYDEAGMRASMLEHNYYLQAHLYVLAADLFLQTRLETYTYERDFGGVFYIFLRGIDRQNGKLGIFRQRPSERSIAALRELAA